MRTRKAGLWAKPHPEATALVSQADPPLLTTPLGIHAFSSWVPPRCPPVGSVWGMRPGTKALTRACGSFSGAPLAEATTQPHRLRVGAASPVQPHLQMGPPCAHSRLFVSLTQVLGGEICHCSRWVTSSLISPVRQQHHQMRRKI